jgi:hypothetical protein
MSFSDKNNKGIAQTHIIIATLVLAFACLIMIVVLLVRSQGGSITPATPTVVPTRIPQPTTRMDITTANEVFKSANFPITITIPQSYGKAKVFVTDNPATKGPNNKNGVMELITFEKSDIYVGIMQKLFNDEFLQENSKFSIRSHNVDYEFKVSQYTKPTGEANADLVKKYQSKFGTYFIRVYSTNAAQSISITAPNVTDVTKTTEELKKLVNNITFTK